MKVHEAKEIFTNKYNEGLTNAGVFFAFSNSQFEENKTHKESTDNEYLSIGCGGYIHKSNIEKYKHLQNVLYKEFEEEYKNNTNIDDVIEYELANHECYWTYDTESAIDVVSSLYSEISKEDIVNKVEEVFKATVKNYES